MNKMPGVCGVRYRVYRKRGVDMPATAAVRKIKGKKKPDINATESLKRDRIAISKIALGRREARIGKTHSWGEIFGD